MNHFEFKEWVKTEWKGHYDHDQKYGSECADLAKGYCQYVLGAPIGSFGGSGAAFNGWANKNNTFPESAYERINASEVPQQGDIVIFNENLSPWGHIGIIETGMRGKILVYDQLGNGEKVGGEKEAKVREYITANVCGYWRRKGHLTTESTTPTPIVQPEAELSPIQKLWESLKGKPGFTTPYQDYKDTTPITRGEAKMLHDIDSYIRK